MAKLIDQENYKAKKRELREGAFILYFESLFRDDLIEDIYSAAVEALEDDGELRITEESMQLAQKIQDKEFDLDEIIEKYSKKRNVDRIPKINLAILRLGLYEATFEERVPVNVAISEAVSIAQKYALDADIAFINGVMGAFSRDKASQDNDNGQASDE